VLFFATFAIYDMIIGAFLAAYGEIGGYSYVLRAELDRGRQGSVAAFAQDAPATDKNWGHSICPGNLASIRGTHGESNICLSSPLRQHVLGLCLLLTTVRQTAPRP
jgi:hypothetical protein